MLGSETMRRFVLIQELSLVTGPIYVLDQSNISSEKLNNSSANLKIIYIYTHACVRVCNLRACSKFQEKNVNYNTFIETCNTMMV